MALVHKTSLVQSNKIPARSDFKHYVNGLISRYQDGIYTPADTIEFCGDLLEDLLHLPIRPDQRENINEYFYFLVQLARRAAAPQNIKENSASARIIRRSEEKQDRLEQQKTLFAALVSKVKSQAARSRNLWEINGESDWILFK